MPYSEDVTFLLLLIFSGLLCFIGMRLFWNRGKLPPGPIPLPVFGNVLQLSKSDIVSSLLKLREKFGDVFTIYLGSRPVVVVNGYKAVKEVYVERGDDFLARGDISIFDINYKNYGLAFTDDINRWKELRRFSLSAMRNFGMGKKRIEDLIQEEAQCLMAELKKTKESFFYPQQFLSKMAGNVIFSIMFGSRREYDDVKLVNILNTINETFLIASSGWGQIFEMFPRIMRLIPGKHQKITSNIEELLHYVKKRVEMNRKTLDSDNPRDYVDAFLIKMEQDTHSPDTEYTLTNLVNSALQIFFAGVETTSTTLTYALLIFMKHPEVLAKVHEEIERVIGHERLPKVQDRNQMPYTDAVIHEIQRFIDLIPMGLPRKTTRDVEFKGYFLPKHTNVYPMLTTVLKDPNCFPHPNEFNPKNFLDENGEFTKSDAFMPLASGKRNCLGEALVRMELFLFIVVMLQNFTLKSEVPLEDLDLNPDVSGLGNVPKLYKIAFIPRDG